jgi:hypothetical protein
VHVLAPSPPPHTHCLGERLAWVSAVLLPSHSTDPAGLTFLIKLPCNPHFPKGIDRTLGLQMGKLEPGDQQSRLLNIRDFMSPLQTRIWKGC